ncbi:uncharacterized protein DNG_01944 [Cephalotrichum gorgonifer]|uniref:Protection of telomeres protein 1 n=1 Tax=Cephalotrichum gorgonifer TaxID=2041049 RepID=A0AAE8SS97_9PEZI|nr:uncharacterized protein DNG_01944 [Cephalotrichum gorgonifer]
MGPSGMTPVLEGATPSQSSSSDLIYPISITTMRDILDEKVSPQALVNIIGLVTDFRPPTPTRGADYKADITLYDASLQNPEDETFHFSIFRPQDLIPNVSAGDVVYIRSAKVQKYGLSSLSVLSHKSTRMFVFTASKIPRPPGDAGHAMNKGPHLGSASVLPNKELLQFVSALYHSIDKSRVPELESFQVMASQAVKNVKNKFQELGNIGEGNFYDLVGQVVRDPFDMGDNVTIWVTDYTENSSFYLFSENAVQDEIYADPMGYGQAQNQGWNGPFGKMALQITCWEPHASVMRKAMVGTSVYLRNVQVRFGRNGSNLEGFLRGDQRNPNKINVEIWNPQEDPENVDIRLKNLLRRKRDYEHERKRQLRGVPSKEEMKKRKAGNDGKQGAKARRLEKRAHLQRTEPSPQQEHPNLNPGGASDAPTQKGSQQQRKEPSSGEEPTRLNPDVCCENIELAASPISSILEPVYFNVSVPGGKGPIRVALPFTNARYRADVRVVDFSPDKLEHFTYSRKTEYDQILEDESDEEEDSSADEESGPRTWRWRFALQLEDASVQAGPKPGRVWAYVDNPDAQALTGLDASNLKYDPQGLVNLRSQMAKLWGNLEERKRKFAEASAERESRRMKSRVEGRAPADDSDSDDASRPQARGGAGEGAQTGLPEIKNIAFPCCLKQFGIRVGEQDPAKADAGEGLRWARRFGLFGTKIQYLDSPESP